MVSISSGPFNNVWAIGKNGCAYTRLGIKEDLLEGTKWRSIEPPQGSQLKQISVGACSIWSIDNNGKMYVRKEITHVFPEGSHWQCINVDPSLTSINFYFRSKLANKHF